LTLVAEGKFSTTDPDSTYLTKGNRAAELGYFDNYLINNESCVIVGVQATAARLSQESAAARDMIDRYRGSSAAWASHRSANVQHVFIEDGIGETSCSPRTRMPRYIGRCLRAALVCGKSLTSHDLKRLAKRKECHDLGLRVWANEINQRSHRDAAPLCNASPSLDAAV
jgi:hypothetical protein